MLSIRATLFLLIIISFSFPIIVLSDPPQDKSRIPMKENFENSLRYVWLNKKVHDSQVIHSMENLSNWSTEGVCKIELTNDRSIDGSSSLRFDAQMRDEALIKRNPGGRMMGISQAILTFAESQDWSKFNRIAIWVYIHPSDIRVHTFYLRFTCIDAPSSITDPKYATVIQNLTPGQWNYVLWEIPNLRRDKVTEFKIMKLATGHHPTEKGIVTYDFDRLELQRIDAEKYEGWDVAENKIAFNHVGYKPEHSKIAITTDDSASFFQIKDANSGQAILTKPTKSVENDKGNFQLLDFSEVRKPGKYFLWTNNRISRPFTISDTLWNAPIYKALNFYYCQRCGFDVPGVHPECHKDWQGIHNGTKKLISGGWHDAGDLSQGSFRTSMSVYAMLELYSQLKIRNINVKLQERILEEARWGLDWLLKSRFDDGFRITWSGIGIYTDGIVGTRDDIITPAQNNPWENFIASATEAFAYSMLKQTHPDIAQQSLQAAEQDWQAAVSLQSQWLDSGKVVLTGDGIIENKDAFCHRWFSGGTYLTLSWGIIASLHLNKITGEKKYAELAADYGRHLIQCQEQEFLDDIPLTGFFYTDPEKTAIVNHRHAAFEESPLLALRSLCEAFPDHHEWIDWYAAATLHSEYFLKRGADFSTPYQALPNAVFRKSDILKVEDQQVREAMLRQFNDGIWLTDEYHLRMLPIWTTKTHHGNLAAQLSHTLALTAASQLRNSIVLENLVAKQFQWVFGGNPFCQSLMYGEGYDYPPLYAYNPGDIVGSLPVGIDCVKDDEPFWSGSNHATFKEIWVVPVSRFLWNAAYFGMPAFVKGKFKNANIDSVQFYNTSINKTVHVPVNSRGEFATRLNAGDYHTKFGSADRRITLVSGGNYEITLNPENNIIFSAKVKKSDSKKKIVSIEIAAKGKGEHKLAIRVFNGFVKELEQEINLHNGSQKNICWDIRIKDENKPWIAVIIPDNDFSNSQEIFGTLKQVLLK